MGSPAIQAPIVAVRRCSPALRRPLLFLSLDSSRSPSVRSVKCSALTSPSEKVKDSRKKSLRKSSAKQSKRVSAVSLEAGPASVASSSSQSTDLNFDEVAEQLENIYKLSPAKVVEEIGDGQDGNFGGMKVVRGKRMKAKRLSMEKRAALNKAKQGATTPDNYEERLLREYFVSGNLSMQSSSWKRMKFPPVLGAAEQTKLFELMQPVKVYLFCFKIICAYLLLIAW